MEKETTKDKKNKEEDISIFCSVSGSNTVIVQACARI